jgi:ABC-type branched-subunit amino acid transport system ATPase component
MVGTVVTRELGRPTLRLLGDNDAGDHDSAALAGATLRIDELSVQFGGLPALRSLTLDVAAGEALAVIGPNGAGKTTLLNAISGLLRANLRGTIEIDGVRSSALSPVAIAKLGVARTFQHPPLIDKETVLENVMVGQHLLRAPSLVRRALRPREARASDRRARARARGVLETVGIEQLEGVQVHALPYGTRKLVDIARAIARMPSLLLLDEPTSGLDEGEQEAIGRLIVDVQARTAVTLIVVEHHMRVVKAVASRVLALETGAVADIGSVEHVVMQGDDPIIRGSVAG